MDNKVIFLIIGLAAIAVLLYFLYNKKSKGNSEFDAKDYNKSAGNTGKEAEAVEDFSKTFEYLVKEINRILIYLDEDTPQEVLENMTPVEDHKWAAAVIKGFHTKPEVDRESTLIGEVINAAAWATAGRVYGDTSSKYVKKVKSLVSGLNLKKNIRNYDWTDIRSEIMAVA